MLDASYSHKPLTLSLRLSFYGCYFTLLATLSDTRQTTRDENNQSEKQTHKHTRYMADAEMLRVAAEIGARVEASHERGAWE